MGCAPSTHISCTKGARLCLFVCVCAFELGTARKGRGGAGEEGEEGERGAEGRVKMRHKKSNKNQIKRMKRTYLEELECE